MNWILHRKRDKGARKAMRCDYYIGREKSCSVEMQVKEAFVCIERARIKARREVVKTDKPHVLFAIHHYAEDAELERVEIYSNMSLSDEELDNMTAMHPGAYFDVLHTDTCKKACQKLIERERSREIRPLTLKEANAFVNTYHRHHSGTVGCKFAIGLFEGGKMIGAAICGRPVIRYLDNGEIC